MTPGQHEFCRFVFRVCSRLSKAPRPRDCILCYHSIQPYPSAKSCTLELFEAHLQWLNNNCEIVPLRSLLDSRVDGHPAPKPRVAVTFDDGHVDNFEHAFPLLSKHRVPATFFLTVGYLDRDPVVMRRFRFFAQGLPKPEPLTWQQAREMAGSGMKIEAHTYSHANLIYLGTNELEFEIKECKKLLEDRIGQKVEGFAYPFGMPRCHFDSKARGIVQEAEYAYAVSTVNRGLRRRDSRWALPRFSIKDDELPVFSDKVSGVWDLLGYFNEWGPEWMARIVSPRGFRESTYD